jgi:capsular polysaccharide biosynthesis protein
MEEEIDLGQYIDVLVRRWYLVILPALVLALGTAAVLLAMPERYEARALVAVARWTTQVSYGTAIETITDDRDAPSAAAATRISSFAELVENASVAQQVLSEVHDRLPADSRTVLALLQSVEGQNVAKSDLIAINATAGNPELARDIANLWAETYVREVNAIYGEVGKGALDAVRAKLASAKADYVRDQESLEKLLQEGTIEELERDIQQRTAAIEGLAEAQTNVINDILDDLRQTGMLIQTANSLRHQVQVADDAGITSSNQALGLLKMHAFAGTDTRQQSSPSVSGVDARQQSLILQMDLGNAPATRAELLRDLDGVIEALETKQKELGAQLEQVLAVANQGEHWGIYLVEATDVSAGSYSSQVRNSLERQIRELSTELERQESLLREAKAQRDLSWQTYDNLVRKEAELALELATAGQFVRLGAPAVAQPVSAGLMRTTVAAGLAGLILGVFAALSLEWWTGYRLRSAAQASEARATGSGN